MSKSERTTNQSTKFQKLKDTWLTQGFGINKLPKLYTVTIV